MFAIIQDSGVLVLGEVPKPEPAAHQLLVRVKATALNRADLLQRRGKYPPPEGESSILGLELAGEVVEIGKNVSQFKIGQSVFGLVGGGSYAEYCLIDEGMAMPIPEGFTFEEAAAIPEAFLTANEALFTLGELKPENSVLIHAGASGVGSAAIQLANTIGAKVYTTIGTPDKLKMVIELGASAAILYKENDFEVDLKNLTQDKGVDVIVDFVGASYLMRNLKSLKPSGRLICVGLMGGSKAEINLDLLLTNTLQIKGLIMRSQPLAKKRLITTRFKERWVSALNTRKIRPVIDSIFPLNDAQLAHERMEANLNAGKIILRVD